MTVKELITRLQKLPEWCKVYTRREGSSREIAEIRVVANGAVWISDDEAVCVTENSQEQEPS